MNICNFILTTIVNSRKRTRDFTFKNLISIGTENFSQTMCNNVFDFDEMIGSSRLGFRVIACEKKIKKRRQKRERKNDEKQVQGRGN